MTSTSLTWPRLLGSTVAAVASGLLLFSAASSGRVGPQYGDSPFERWLWIVWLLGCTLFVLLSYPLYRAREWARKVLLILVTVITVLCALRAGGMFFQRWSHEESVEPWMRRQALAENVAGTLLLVAPPLFLSLLLCHRDVVASFRVTPTQSRSRSGS